ncbi:MAG TPA: hypothetical protein VKW06_09200 [Candidatus Angelobacter sp.]|nr:hypothetical protein [Candidatus Angelobacter sp.]
MPLRKYRKEGCAARKVVETGVSLEKERAGAWVARASECCADIYSAHGFDLPITRSPDFLAPRRREGQRTTESGTPSDPREGYDDGMKSQKTPEKPHPGITMHRIRVGGDAMGLLAAVAAVLLCIVGFPEARWFLVAAILVGLVAAVAFRVWHQRRPSDVDRLSILTNEPAVSEQSTKQKDSTPHSLLSAPSAPLAI